MGVLNKVRIIIYRFHEKGLEILLVNSDLKDDPDIWKIPKGAIEAIKADERYNSAIELDPILDADGSEIVSYAIEGDWHDIPSLRGLLKHDVKVAKQTIKEIVPGIEKGAYFAVKEAFKKVMPTEYKALKELKDILKEKNLIKYI